MRIIHTGDWHLGKNLEGHSRLDEQEKFLDFFTEKCNELKPELILIAGDIYDAPNPPARAEKLFYDALKKLSRGGECVSVVIAGNHDNPERIASAGSLAAEHGIIISGTPKAVVQTGAYGKHRVTASGEGFFELEINGERAVIAAVAYPSEKRLNEVFYRDKEDEKERQASYAKKVGRLFKRLEANFKEDSINITLSHLFASGSEPSGSERSSSLGGSFIINTELLPKHADYTALGHIHKPQILPNTGGRVRYCGSPIHYNKTEISFNKSFYYIDINKNKAKNKPDFNIGAVQIPVFKPICIWKAKSAAEAIEMCKQHSGEESWVYLEIKCGSYIREDEIKQMKTLKKDIIEIRPVIEAQENKRKLEISELSFKDKFIEFYKQQNKNTPDKELIQMLLSIMEEEAVETD